MKEPDAKDRKILNCLIDDARMPYREVARRTGLSVVTVMKRVNALREAGVIKQFTTILDYEKLGYEIHSVIEFKAEKKQFELMEEYLSNNPNIGRLVTVTGTVDAVAFAVFRHRRELDTFLREVQRHPSITDTVTRLVLKIAKDKRVKV